MRYHPTSPEEMVHMRRIRFRIWHGMTAVALAALMASGFAWLFRLLPLHIHDTHIHDTYISVTFAGHWIPPSSPWFPVVVCILLTAILGIVVLLIAALWWAVRALNLLRNRSLQRPPKQPR